MISIKRGLLAFYGVVNSHVFLMMEKQKRCSEGFLVAIVAILILRWE